jgi:hypothetical protein
LHERAGRRPQPGDITSSDIKIPEETEYRIIFHLLLHPHASFVARAEGISFSKVWRLAERECIELTAGRVVKGYKRLSPDRRAKVIEVRRANPNASQEQIVRIVGVSRSTVWRIERGQRGRWSPWSDNRRSGKLPASSR